MAGRRRLAPIIFDVAGVMIEPSRAVKYLGFWLSRDRRYIHHILKTADKAEEMIRTLSRLMTNVGGPRSSKRRVLASVVSSVALYGAPCWIRDISVKKCRDRLLQVGRRAALRVCSAYRTVSGDAASVIAGIPPLDLVASERSQIAAGRSRSHAKDELWRLWQQRWTSSSRAAWTRQLIPEVKAWAERKNGEVGYYLTQFLTGHGSFGDFLHRIGKRTTDICEDCDEEPDSPYHVFFECPCWRQLREDRLRVTGDLTTLTLVTAMLNSEDTWRAVETFICSVLKNRDERSRTS